MLACATAETAEALETLLEAAGSSLFELTSAASTLDDGTTPLMAAGKAN